MGPAILLCPSSSAAHLWRQTAPPLKPKQKESTFPVSPRLTAGAGDLAARPRFFLYHASTSEKCRKYFTWRRVAAASASSEVSVEEASIGGAVAVSEIENATPFSLQDLADEKKDEADAEKSTVDSEQDVANEQQSTPAEADQEVMDAAQAVVDAAETAVAAVQSEDEGEQHVADAEKSVVDAGDSVLDNVESVDDGDQHAGEAAQAAMDSEESATSAEEVMPNTVQDVEAEAAVGSDTVSSTSGKATPAGSGGTTRTGTERMQSRRSLSRSTSKRTITVSQEELVQGAQFSGKVVSIQSFGAFVDFGAFTNGLVHISRLSKSYVQKVEDVVQVGEDVRVQLLEIDFEAKRISLMLLREESQQEDQTEVADRGGKVSAERLQGGKVSAERPQQQTRTPRRDSPKRVPSKPTTTLKVGEIVTGTVKNVIKSGAFLSLPDGTDGYLPVQEVIFRGTSTLLESQFHIGDEVTVRVLRVDRGRVNLTMRREVDYDKINEDLNKGVLVTGTNPFELAFRKNEVIASYLAERDKLKAQAEAQTGDVREAVVSSD